VLQCVSYRPKGVHRADVCVCLRVFSLCALADDLLLSFGFVEPLH
jgi:hypothetical protein